jgi:hypothetical protein
MSTDDTRRLIANHMSEQELEDAILDQAQTLGWLRFHALPARSKDGNRWRTHQRGDVGFPDLSMVHPKTGKVAVFELKTEKGYLTEAQQGWVDGWMLAAERAANTVAAGVWRPIDWLDGTIGEILLWGTRP